MPERRASLDDPPRPEVEGASAHAASSDDAPRLDPITLLTRDGLIEPRGDRLRTTRRWQAAMMRAIARAMADGRTDDDLRVPIAGALVELYGEALDDAALIALVHALLPIEAAELGA